MDHVRITQHRWIVFVSLVLIRFEFFYYISLTCVCFSKTVIFALAGLVRRMRSVRHHCQRWCLTIVKFILTSLFDVSGIGVKWVQWCFAKCIPTTINVFVNRYKMTIYHDNILELSCPGYYCGRLDLGNGRTSDCGSCPTGTRVNLTHIFCQPCTDSPSSYDLMYLLFMATVPLLFHAVYIDLSLSSISWASQAKRYLFEDIW